MSQYEPYTSKQKDQSHNEDDHYGIIRVTDTDDEDNQQINDLGNW